MSVSQFKTNAAIKQFQRLLSRNNKISHQVNHHRRFTTALDDVHLNEQPQIVLPPFDSRFRYIFPPQANLTVQPVCYRPLIVTESFYARFAYNESTYLQTQPVYYLPLWISEPLQLTEAYFTRSRYVNQNYAQSQFARYLQSLQSSQLSPQQAMNSFNMGQFQQQQQHQQPKPITLKTRGKEFLKTAKTILGPLTWILLLVKAVLF